MQYIVFQDSFTGFKHLHQYDGEDLKEVIQSITDGYRMPTQYFMYYIYKKHQFDVPLFGTRFDVYIKETAVAGYKVERPHLDSHQYALTHNSSMAWFFTDDIFGDH